MNAQGELIGGIGDIFVAVSCEFNKLAQNLCGDSAAGKAPFAQDGYKVLLHPPFKLCRNTRLIDGHGNWDYTSAVPQDNQTLVPYTQTQMTRCRFTEIEHTADWSLLVEAGDLPGLLSCAAEGMFHLLQLQAISHNMEVRQVVLEAPDQEGLLVRWLEELLFYLEQDGLMATTMDLTLKPTFRLEATLSLAPAKGSGIQIKGVTYHDLEIEREGGGLRTTVVFDV